MKRKLYYVNNYTFCAKKIFKPYMIIITRDIAIVFYGITVA